MQDSLVRLVLEVAISTLTFQGLVRTQLRVLPVADKRMILLDQGAPPTLPFQAARRPASKQPPKFPFFSQLPAVALADILHVRYSMQVIHKGYNC
jgi:hypothetical protein